VFYNLNDVQSKTKALQEVVKQQLNLIEK